MKKNPLPALTPMIDWIQNLLVEHGVLPNEMRRSLTSLMDECEAIFHEATGRCLHEFPHRIQLTPEAFTEKMRDLQHGVLLKTMVDIAWRDRSWSDGEKDAAKVIISRIWNVNINSDSLQKSLRTIVNQAGSLKWNELLRPFTDIPELTELLAELIAVIIKLANFICKLDDVTSEELLQLESMRKELTGIYKAAKSQASNRRQKPGGSQSQALQLNEPMIEMIHSATTATAPTGSKSADPNQANRKSTPQPVPDETTRKQRFDEGMNELETLIGLDSIKQEIKQLISFLKMQAAREKISLPTTPLSLHSLYTGNPGTGKTTVARVVGKLLFGLGILSKGHTVEVDRSGLVAEYAGQTGPKAHACIDTALDGVLFIDEAYSLISSSNEDAYGREAVQVLLKRMEDDRDRLVVILAGYPAPMEELIRSNPGLTSRFQRRFEFSDYEPEELLKIFAGLCRKYHYKWSKDAKEKVKRGFRSLVSNKDEHFGNGRTVRNIFESALQKMATRISAHPEMTESILTEFHPDDFDLEVTGKET
jgi:AAA+ superfamily predicted ATPase